MSGIPSAALELRHEKVIVGMLTNIFEHQGTWFGIFQQTISPNEGATQGRLCEFILFCSDWNRRCGAGLGADVTEFDQFRDLLVSGHWQTEARDGTVRGIDRAPNFSDDEVSWQYA